MPGRSALRARRAVGGRGGVATPVAPAPSADDPYYASPATRAAGRLAAASPDTLLPGAFSRPDNLLPRATRASASTTTPAPPTATPAAPPPAPPIPAPVQSIAAPVTAPVTAPVARPARAAPPVGARAARERAIRDRWRHGIVLVVVAVALLASIVAVWPVAFDNGGTTPLGAAPALNEARATDLLRTVAGGAHTVYAAQGSYSSLTASSLSAGAYNVPVVGPSEIAKSGSVSFRVDDAAVLTLASPADARHCVFARDDAAHARTLFATVATQDCRASSAPADGWTAQ